MGWLNEQKKLMQIQVENLLKEKLPMDKDKAVSLIMYEMGFSRISAKEYVKIFFDIERIGYDDKGLLVWIK